MTAPRCSLTKNSSGASSTLYLTKEDAPNCGVTGISRSYSVSLSEASISTKKAENKYIIDLGVTETISIKVARTEPVNGNDASSNQHDWSNAKWLRYVQNFFDGWQNLNKDEHGNTAGGFTLRWSPDKEGNVQDKDMFPEIERNVFLNNNLEVTSGMYLSLTLNFTVGSLKPTSSSESKSSYKFTYQEV